MPVKARGYSNLRWQILKCSPVASLLSRNKWGSGRNELIPIHPPNDCIPPSASCFHHGGGAFQSCASAGILNVPGAAQFNCVQLNAGFTRCVRQATSCKMNVSV